jgi:Protein of unknown function (DUF2796)
MRKHLIVPLSIALSATLAQAQEQRRELPAHVHGAGTLNIAIDGKSVTMEFNAPANDIVGFEHEPSTADQRKAITAAKKRLINPLVLFVVPPAAGCSVKSAEVKFDTGHGKDKPAMAEGDKKTDAAQPKHADFDGDYTLTCKAPDKLQSIQFAYFKSFPGAQKLTVNVNAAKQQQYEVTAASPTLSLK